MRSEQEYVNLLLTGYYLLDNHYMEHEFSLELIKTMHKYSMFDDT